MDGARHQLLAHARLSQDQHRRVRARRRLHLGVHVLHGPAPADHAEPAVLPGGAQREPAPQVACLAHQAASAPRPWPRRPGGRRRRRASRQSRRRPAFRQRTAMAMSPCPVIITTGGAPGMAVTWARNSSPSMPGIFTSVMMHMASVQARPRQGRLRGGEDLRRASRAARASGRWNAGPPRRRR